MQYNSTLLAMVCHRHQYNAQWYVDPLPPAHALMLGTATHHFGKILARYANQYVCRMLNSLRRIRTWSLDYISVPCFHTRELRGSLLCTMHNHGSN
eukprot:scaffold40081_cov562-Skeletonema_marinoi.AAC.1